MDYAMNNLFDYYNQKYPLPKNDVEAINTIIRVYQTEIGDCNEKIGEGIGEIYRELLGKGQPAYYWFLEAIHRTSKKKEEKRSFGYIVGTLRNWSLYGFGNTLTGEEEEVYDFFMEVTGTQLTSESRKFISHLMGTYGALKLMRSIAALREVDASLMYAELLRRVTAEKYNENLGLGKPKRINYITPLNGLPNPNRSVRKYNRSTGDELKQLIHHVEEYLKTNGISTPTDIVNYLNANGFNKFTQKNISSYLVTVMKKTNKVVKVTTGQYAYVEGDE